MLCAACAEPPAAPTGAVVVGVTSDFVPGTDVARLTADVRAGDAWTERREWTMGGREPLTFPLELWLADLPDGARVDVAFAAYEGLSEQAEPFARRETATSVVVDSTLLLRAHLEWECVPSFHLPSGALAPTCQSPDTCIAAACEDPYVAPGSLEPYSSSWAVDYADECRPAGAGEPEVLIGRGLDSFEPVEPAGPVLMEKGSQGGFHVWLALRARNLHRRGAVTTLEVSREDTGDALCHVEVPWDFAPSEGGACDLPGIQCIVSFDILGAAELAGKAARISAKVVDLTGDVAFAESVVTLDTPP